MTAQDRTTLKGYFETGDTPTQSQFGDFIDSVHNSTDDGDAAAHITSTSNPHSVTKSQVGLGSVPNLDTTDAVANEHTHANKALLDTYTQTEADIADAISKEHVHANQSVLDNTTASFTTADETKLDYITVTQAVDLDQMETDIAALANGMVYKENWDASAGTFPGGGSAEIGWFYTVSVGGTVDSIAFAVGDRLIATTDNASTTTYTGNWSKLDATDAVTSVDGNTGAVDLSSTYAPISHNHAASDVNSGTFADARIAESSVTQHEGAIDHGSVAGLSDDDHTIYTKADGTRAFSGKVSYSTHPTFTADTELVDKKYVDDAITGGGGYTDEQAQDTIGAAMTDSSEIDFTYDDGAGTISAAIVAGSIDETKLDTSVNASLDLADSSVQPGDNVSDLINDAGYITSTLTDEEVQDKVGDMLSGNTETLITVTYQDGDGTIDFVVDSNLANYDNTTSAFISDITGENLENLADVTITSNTSGEILKWNGSAWINNTLAEAGIAAASHTHATTDITSGTFADARISESSVTQHEGALSITESQISDLGNYSKVTSGAGVPASTPTKVGDIYIDTTNDNAYTATGTASSADWEINNDGAGGGISDGDKGDITVSGSGATWTIDNDVVTYAKMQNVSATDRILGRDTTGAGDIEELTPSAVRTMLNVADGAEANTVDSVNSQTGAVVLDADDIDDTSTTNKFTTAGDISKLANIEALADVTDTANVTAAGALMDSEVTSLSGIKTLTVPDSTTISTFGASLIDDADASAARTTLGVDAAGTDNSTNVTLTGTPDYITISGQVITRNQIDLATDVTGVLPLANQARNEIKSITVEDPTGSEDISMFFTNAAITITEMRAVLVGSSTPSVTWTIRHGSDRSATGAEVVTSGTTTTSTTTGSDVTSFNDATIPADSFVWLETSAQSGTVDSINISLIFNYD